MLDIAFQQQPACGLCCERLALRTPGPYRADPGVLIEGRKCSGLYPALKKLTVAMSLPWSGNRISVLQVAQTLRDQSGHRQQHNGEGGLCDHEHLLWERGMVRGTSTAAMQPLRRARLGCDPWPAQRKDHSVWTESNKAKTRIGSEGEAGDENKRSATESQEKMAFVPA